MKKITGAIFLVFVSGLNGQVVAGDATAGKSKAASCAGCHGPAGISN